MWKQMNPPNPVDDFCEYEADDNLISNLPTFVDLLTTTAEALTQQDQLWTEIKIFQNVQAKYKRILHCDKCLQLLQRVGIYLRKMVLLNISKSYLDLAEPFLKGVKSTEPKRLLPSRQQVEYTLIRTQSAAKLICEALHYSRETFCYLIQRLKVGHMILNLMMATSVTARLNKLFKGILVMISDLYRQIYLWLPKFKEGNFQWPVPLDLPENLEDWLKAEGDLNEPKQLPTEQLSFLKEVFKKKHKSLDQENKDLVIDIESEDDDCAIVADTTQQMESMDFGEVVERDTNDEEMVPKETEDSAVSSSFKDDADVSSTTHEENLLLKVVKEAKSYKQLLTIWKSIEGFDLPRKLTEKRCLKVNAMFKEYLQEVKHIKSKPLTEERRKLKKRKSLRKYQTQFCKFLHLTPETSQDSFVNDNSEVHKKPETLKELVSLYSELYAQLEAAKEGSKCKKLKKMFKSRKSDIKLLLDNNEEGLAKQLIACTSKILLTKYVV